MLKRIIAILLDVIILGITVYLSLELFFPAAERMKIDTIFMNHLSNIIFIVYLILSLIIFKQTIGMKLLNLKLKTKCCIIKVVIIRIILIPLYILNVIYYLKKERFIQDDLSDSTVE